MLSHLLSYHCLGSDKRIVRSIVKYREALKLRDKIGICPHIGVDL